MPCPWSGQRWTLEKQFAGAVETAHQCLPTPGKPARREATLQKQERGAARACRDFKLTIGRLSLSTRCAKGRQRARWAESLLCAANANFARGCTHFHAAATVAHARP